jgi:hypothetical protein
MRKHAFSNSPQTLKKRIIRRTYFLAFLLITNLEILGFAQNVPGHGVGPVVIVGKGRGTTQMNAVLEGTVTDTLGKSLSGVYVNYKNLEIGYTGGLLATSKGRYRISYYPGPYFVEVKRRGFRTWRCIGIIMKANEAQHLDIVLTPEGDPDIAVPLRTEDYIKRAVESVRTRLESRHIALDRFHFEVAGNPVVQPNRGARLSKVKANDRASFELPLPDAMVLVKITEAGKIRSTALVSFLDQEPQVMFYDWDPLSDRSYPMDETEWAQVVKELEPFYTVALRTSDGPDRFDPFIQPFINAAREQPAGLTKSQLAQIACLRFDQFTLTNWLQFEGLAFSDTPEKSAAKLRALQSPADLPKALNNLSKGLTEWRELLKKPGASESDHLLSVSPYMRRMLGEDLIFKNRGYSRTIRALPRAIPVYTAFFCHIGCDVHFAYVDGRLQIVGIDGIM